MNANQLITELVRFFTEMKPKSPKRRSGSGARLPEVFLFGGVGAIVGAVTGGKKKKEKRRKYFIIAFNVDNYLKFEDTAPGQKSQAVPDEMKKRCGINDVKIEWS